MKNKRIRKISIKNMELITQTSLEALLMKATSCSHQNIDTAAVEAFCALINKEKDGAHIGVKVIASRIHSGVEKEVLQTLNILDICMSRCGTHFQSEVGKFRFLNEMIKLVSPKYLGSQTPLTVKQKVLQLMYVWTVDYPKESKIKEAYDMLRKQGVIKDIPNPHISTDSDCISKRRHNSIFQDEEKSKILQKLLQSKDPEDIQAANWLIKSMVKEDDKRAELKNKRISELESVQNNVRLLNDMLNSYKPGASSKDEIELIKELHESCKRFRPNIMKLASEVSQNEEILGDILQVNDELEQIFTKYETVILNKITSTSHGEGVSLLDFEHTTNGDQGAYSHNSKTEEVKSDIDVLCDIFNASGMHDDVVLKPLAAQSEINGKVADNKLKALEELDFLSEHLLKENLQGNQMGKTFNRIQDKTPLNMLTKQNENKSNMDSQTNSMELDLSYLIRPKGIQEVPVDQKDTLDDYLVDITEEKISQSSNSPEKINAKTDCGLPKSKTARDFKLNDIFVNLEQIKPSSIPPLTILEEKNGVSITLHFAKDRPREDVQVFVVTTVSKNELPLSNYLFQAVVPKSCKLKLQSPSSTNLPAFNPFLPPSAISQVMLIANPDDVQIFLKFIVSYVMDDETITEMGEIDNLPKV